MSWVSLQAPRRICYITQLVSSKSTLSLFVTAEKHASTFPTQASVSCMQCSIGAIMSMSLFRKNLKSFVEIAWWFFLFSCSDQSFSLFCFAFSIISIKWSSLARLRLFKRITFLRQDMNTSFIRLFIFGMTKSLKSQSGKPFSAIWVRYFAIRSIIDSSN